MHHPIHFRPNHPDELHCVPCSVGMLFEGLTGKNYSDSELEKICGFVPGEEVWQFKWMLAAAARGLTVRSVDNFDAERFIESPRAELLRQTENPEVVDRIFEVSDVDGQVAFVRACLENPLIVFTQRVPSFEELDEAVTEESGALVNVNARVLSGKDGYAGHVVLLHRSSAGDLLLEDPGPPSHEGFVIDRGEFVKAWHSPSPRMANYIRVAPTK